VRAKSNVAHLLPCLAGWLLLAAGMSCGGTPKPTGSPTGPRASASPLATAAPTAEPSATADAGAAKKAPEGKGRPPVPGDQDPAGSGAKKGGDAKPAIEPCTPGSAEHDQAKLEFDKLDRQIDGLAPTDDHGPASKALRQLLELPCYRLAKLEQPESLEADSALALRELWQRGGRLWLAHYLKLGGKPNPGEMLRSVVPPSAPNTLTKQSAKGHPLRALLCSATDPACDRATQGWEERAEQSFEAFARTVRLRWATHDPKGSAIQSPKSCSAMVRALPAQDRYVRWWDCVASLPLRAASLPLGGIDAPRDGWLLIRGRRGHHDFCDELRAYDVATGAAYVAQSCGRLALGHTGRVDPKTTDAARRIKTLTGRLVADNIREATWMMLLADHVTKPAVRRAESFAIPGHVTVTRPPGKGRLRAGYSTGTSSAHTVLAWTYLRRGRALDSGTLSWPSSYDDAAANHAVALLQVAEKGFSEGCPPAGLPPRLDLGKGVPGVSPVDTSRRSQNAIHDELVEALNALRKIRICR
jgi:hypothetical protein